MSDESKSPAQPVGAESKCVLMWGGELAQEIEAGVAAKVRELAADGIVPTLALVMMGDDPVTHRQIDLKKAAAERVGIRAEKHVLPEMASQTAINELLERLSLDDGVDGIFVQLPLPRHIDRAQAGRSVAVEKDIDLLGPVSLGAFYLGHSLFQPALALAVDRLLHHYQVRVSGSDVAILGLGHLASQPLALLFTREQATVTVCHLRTRDLNQKLSRADILIAAIDDPNFVRWDMVKESAVVVDLGQNVLGERIVGDVDQKAVRTKASAITPVPGGVGPVIIAAILQNTLSAALARRTSPR